MIDETKIDELRLRLCDRFTPDELIDLLGVSTEQVFERFLEECMELEWE